MKTLFLTSRSLRHQQHAIEAAPPQLTITMLRDPDRDSILHEIQDADFLISERAGTIDRAIIESGAKLRLIQRLGSQTHDIDVAAAVERNIPVCYWPIPGVIAVAEHVVWQMLALARRAHEVEDALHAPGDWGVPRRTDENVFAYNWTKRSSPVSLWQRTVGILGFGEIGVEAARRLRSFGCPLLYNKRIRLPERVEVELGLRYVDLSTLLAQSDFVCSLLPYAPETDYLLDAKALAQMKPGAFLVHCGSGSVIDEDALADVLRGGRLGGAALDTFEWEPLPPESPLRALALDPSANVVLTPHTAAVSERHSRTEEYRNLLAVLTGDPLRYQLA